MLPVLKKAKHKKSPQHTAQAHIAFLGATIIWAAAGPVIKLTLQHIPPTTFLYLRFLIVCIIMMPYAVLEVSKAKIHRKDYFALFLLGVFSQTSIWLAFWALKFTSVLDYTIISMSGVILSIYAGHHFFHDKFNKPMVYGLFFATVGTFLVVIEPILSDGQNYSSIIHRLMGNITAILYNLTWVIYVVMSKFAMGDRSKKLKKLFKRHHFKPLLRSYSPTLIVTISFYIGLLTITPFALLENLGLFGDYNFTILSMGHEALFGLIYMALLSSIAAYMLYQWGLENAHVSDSAIYGYLSPVFTLPFAYILLGEVPNSFMLIGAAFIAAGVLIAEKYNT